jgi:hypothetical protein
MMHWTKLAVAGIAAIGAAAIATPASAAGGLQSHKLVTPTGAGPEVMLIDYNKHYKYRKHRRYRDNDDFDVNIGLGFPFFAFGGYPYGYGGYPSRYSYYDNDYDDSWLHCHGKRYRYHNRIRCRGNWHRHFN